MLRHKLMRLIDVAALTIGLVFATSHITAAPITVTNAASHTVCIRAVGPHEVAAHTVKAYTRKGVYHPAHEVAAHTSSGHVAFCYVRKSSSGVRHHRAYCVAPKPAHWVGDHMSKPYTRKGVYHPSHFVAGHTVSARKGYCVAAK